MLLSIESDAVDRGPKHGRTGKLEQQHQNLKVTAFEDEWSG
jgi:hypothetical protein